MSFGALDPYDDTRLFVLSSPPDAQFASCVAMNGRISVCRRRSGRDAVRVVADVGLRLPALHVAFGWAPRRWRPTTGRSGAGCREGRYSRSTKIGNERASKGRQRPRVLEPASHWDIDMSKPRAAALPPQPLETRPALRATTWTN